MTRWMCRCFWIVKVVCLVAVYCSLAEAQNECAGVEHFEYLHSENIKDFRDCVIITGNLIILKASFDGSGTKAIKPNDLQILKDVIEVFGFVKIKGTPPEVKDLSFLSRLETIRGKILYSWTRMQS
ncbi:receptor tyrosine-protein kinase erbB-4-like [Mercenaria mercenaria]|uniref:receptor tyrosine-protein kinase erbB-4-like n=1 Tax=Mercenaria mercenaria TaxID=6596 RepID=UPI00234E7020|nr:receptor tyrosine-protein kinase erbB-4-like [Mercenaria mercenaria]